MVGDEPRNTSRTLQEAIESCRCKEESDECCLSPGEERVITPQSRRDLRSLAFHYLYVADAFNYDITMDEIIEQFTQGYKVKVEGTDFPERLAAGVIEDREKYAAIIEPLLENWRFERIGCCTRLILYMALWEFEQDGAVASIIINEAVELAKAFAEKDAYRFINGILDQAKNQYPQSLVQENSDEQSDNSGDTKDSK